MSDDRPWYAGLLRRYGLAVALTALATALALTLTLGVSVPSVGLLAFPMVVLASAWFEGMGPGIVSAILSALAVAFFFMKPVGSLTVEAPAERIVLVAFVMTSLVESTVVGTSRRSERSMSRMAESIARSERKYRILFERNPEPMWIFDPRTRAVLAANEAALTTYGYEGDEILGMRLDAIFEAGDADRFLADEAQRDQRTWSHLTKRGERLEVETRCARATWMGGPACVMAARDMTSRVQAERELLTANEELQRAKRVAEGATKGRDRFLRVLSHELRTPLTPALLATDALERRQTLPHEVRRSLQLIRAKVKQEAALIDDVLDVAHIVSGDFEPEKTPADATQIVARAVAACRDEAEAKRVAVTRELTAVKCTTWVDAERLQRAIGSALSTAIDAAPPESVVRVWTSNGAKGEVAIGVHHDGETANPGALFDPFERGMTPRTPGAWDLALRLAIGKAVVEACGGSVEATSDRKGTNVVIRLRTVA
ncbi:MAG TPA: DUF4118 domain-containing protein [Polyangiaceae bacterium]